MPDPTAENRVLATLLANDFDGANELREQAKVARVERSVVAGSPVLRFHFDQPVKKALVRQRIPIEGEFELTGDDSIHCLLHVVDGLLSELEFYRENGAAIESFPDVSRMTVIPNS